MFSKVILVLPIVHIAAGQRRLHQKYTLFPFKVEKSCFLEKIHEVVRGHMHTQVGGWFAEYFVELFFGK